MTALGMFILGAGLFLVWCAFKGQNPKDVLMRTVGAAAPGTA